MLITDLEQEGLGLALLIRADATDDKGVVGRGARVALEGDACHLGGALELGRVGTVVHVGDQFGGHAHVLDDEVLRVLGNRLRSAVSIHRPLGEQARWAAGMGRASGRRIETG